MRDYDVGSDKHNALTEALTNFITSGMVPICTVEKPSFKKLVRTFDSKYKLPGRNFFSHTAIPALYSKVCDEVKNELKQVNYVSLTTDGWFSTCRDPYLSLIVHYIDNNWTLQKKCLHTMYWPESHTGDNIAAFIKDDPAEYGMVPANVTSVTTDGAANMVSACAKFGVTRLGCFGHLLHNAISNGLNNDDSIKELLVLSWKIVSTFSYSFPYRQKLTKVQKELKLPIQSLINDVLMR